MEPDLNGFAENYRTLFGLKKRNIREYSAMGFAYIGDAVYELAVRTYVVEHYNAPVQKMHRITSSLVKAQTQAAVADAIMDELTPQEARKQFGLDPDKKTILLVGGSLGARTVNESVRQHFDMVKANPDVQFIWQTGKYYNEEMKKALSDYGPLPNLKQMDFIADMGTAYKAADLVISRAGASSISEFCLIGKPVILVPSPNVAEDHQTKNAMALVNKNAAVYVKDSEAADVLLKQALAIVHDDKQLASLSQNIAKLGLKDSADVIADEVIKLAQHGTERY